MEGKTCTMYTNAFISCFAYLIYSINKPIQIRPMFLFCPLFNHELPLNVITMHIHVLYNYVII